MLWLPIVAGYQVGQAVSAESAEASAAGDKAGRKCFLAGKSRRPCPERRRCCCSRCRRQAMSILPSPSKSFNTISSGPFGPPERRASWPVGGVVKFPNPLPSSILMASPLKSLKAKSIFPSPFKSAASTANGFPPADMSSMGSWNVPSPLPSSVATLLSPQSVTAMSGMPSWLKSAMQTWRGLVPTVYGTATE